MNHEPVLMFEACLTSQHEALERMIAQGQSVNHPLPGQLRLLHIAVSRGDEIAVTLILAQNPDVDAISSKGETALYMAATSGNRNIVTLLQRAHANINLSNNRGETPLYAAMANRHYECARLLLWIGALTDIRNIHGLRAEDASPVMDQPSDLIDLLRAAKMRERRI